MFRGDLETGPLAACIFGVPKGGRYHAEMQMLLEREGDRCGSSLRGSGYVLVLTLIDPLPCAQVPGQGARAGHGDRAAPPAPVRLEHRGGRALFPGAERGGEAAVCGAPAAVQPALGHRPPRPAAPPRAGACGARAPRGRGSGQGRGQEPRSRVAHSPLEHGPTQRFTETAIPEWIALAAEEREAGEEEGRRRGKALKQQRAWEKKLSRPWRHRVSPPTIQIGAVCSAPDALRAYTGIATTSAADAVAARDEDARREAEAADAAEAALLREP